MIDSAVFWTRTKRYARQWVRDAVAETIAPLTDTNARLNYIGVFVVLLLLSPRRGADKQMASLLTTLEVVETALYSIPVFFLLNFVFALFRVRKKERELGEWFGPRFVYHEPRRLITALVDEQNNHKPLRFSIDDAEHGALVSYVIETDRTDTRVKAELAWPGGQRPMDFGVPMNLPRGSFRLPKSREMSLLTNVEPESTLSTVRVFMTNWEVGKGDGR